VGTQEELVHDLFDGRQLVVPLEHAEAQRVLDLLHELDVGRDPGVALQAELKHLIVCSYELLNMQSYDSYNTAKPICQGRVFPQHCTTRPSTFLTSYKKRSSPSHRPLPQTPTIQTSADRTPNSNLYGQVGGAALLSLQACNKMFHF